MRNAISGILVFLFCCLLVGVFAFMAGEGGPTVAASKNAIVPGVGIAGLRLGQTRAEVIKALGPPQFDQKPAGTVREPRVSYMKGKNQEETLDIDFDPAKNTVVRFVCSDPRYILEGHPSVHVNCEKSEVNKIPAFAKNDGGMIWDFNSQGIRFCFNGRGSRTLPRYGEGKLETIVIYPTGKSNL